MSDPQLRRQADDLRADEPTADPFDVPGLEGMALTEERHVSGRRVYLTTEGGAAFDAMFEAGFEFWPDRPDGWLQTLVSSERRRMPELVREEP